jgi:hypothetical protein
MEQNDDSSYDDIVSLCIIINCPTYCIIQYVEKDADTATPIPNSFFQCWPWSSSGKQVMILNDLEEILELLGGADQLIIPSFDDDDLYQSCRSFPSRQTTRLVLVEQ